jgi:transcription elongation factor GreA
MKRTMAHVEELGWITQSGHAALCAELERLRKVERPAAAEQVRFVRLDGGLADNPGLIDVMEHQARIEQRIASLTERIATCRIFTTETADRAEIGTHVVVLDLGSEVTMSFDLVGPFEADAELGRVSTESPIGAAIHGLVIGEIGIADTPRGPRRLRLVEVSNPLLDMASG